MPVITPSGPHLIQHLNIIIYNDLTAMGGGPDWPYPNFVYDPSSPGQPEGWPVIYYNPDGTPNHTITTYTRSPGAGDGMPRKIREGGQGHPHPPDQLTHSDGSDAPHKCFVGQLRILITKPPPDFFGYTGTSLSLVGALCAPYAPPGITGPTTGFVMRTIIDTPLGLTPGVVPLGTLIPDVLAYYLWVNVGHDAFGVVNEDFYDGGTTDCIAGASQTGEPACGGTITPSSHPGTSIGVVINAAPLS